MRPVLGALFLILACLPPQVGMAEAVPLAKAGSAEVVLERARLEQRISTGTTALESGLASLAEKAFSQVLDVLPAEDPRHEVIRLMWVSALLATGNLEVAEKALAGQNVPDTPPWKLRQAMLDLALGQRASASGRLQGLHEAELPELDRPWLLYVRGVLQWDAGAQDAGLVLMDRAAKLAVLPSQQAQMELAAYQRRVFAGPVSPELIENLRKKVDAFHGKLSGFQFAQEYALALHKTGKKAEALTVLEKHLSLLSTEASVERGQFLLLIGLLSPAESGRGLLALQELVRGGGARQTLLLGLHMLLSRWPQGDTAQGDWINYLGSLLAELPTHPLRGELLLLLAQAAFEQKKSDLARQSADAYLKEFPQAENAPDALQLLACISLSSQPPQYRTAAAILSRIRDKSENPAEKLKLGIQLADCHFLAGDFENAATLYGSVSEAASGNASAAVLAYQHVLALLHGGQLDPAIKVLDALGPSSAELSGYRWRAEWNLLSRLKAAGRQEEAFSRVRDTLKAGAGKPGGSLPIALVLRLRWMEAHLALEVGRPAEATQYADGLLESLAGQPKPPLEKQELENLQAGTLLLKVRGHLAQHDFPAAEPFITRLREAHPGTPFAQSSYLLEASYHYQADDLVKAQQLSVKLADDFPENPMAPIALMEAAQFAEKRGSENFYKEALTLLERLSSQYPSHELVFYARLRQGHLFRKLNQFGNAQQIYANLVNQFPEHPELNLALLSNADCQLAQAGDDVVRFEVAINLLERLFLQSDLPVDVSVEAGYKLAFAHGQMGKSGDAQEVLGSSLDRFLLNPETGQQRLGVQGRYWMSRSILELGTLLEVSRIPDEARIVYGLIEENNLPGRSLANSRIEQLGI